MGLSLSTYMHNNMFAPPILNQTIINQIMTDPKLTFKTIRCFSGPTIHFLEIKPTTSNKWIVFSHGNAETIFHNCYYALMLTEVLGTGCIFYDYPGYGYSTGEPLLSSPTKGGGYPKNAEHFLGLNLQMFHV